MIHRKQMVEFADILVMFYNSGKKAIEIPEIEKEKRNHKVRSLIDQMRRANKIRRVGPSTWEKI